jgi:hypothetical protein
MVGTVRRFVMSDAEIIAAVEKVFKGKTLRVVKPGDTVTMDFRDDRVTVRLHHDGTIASVSVG